jgi:hypothetical protein
LVVVQIDFLLLNRTPEALDEDIIERPSTPIPVDLNARPLQPMGVDGAGELGALVGVEDAGPPLPQGISGAAKQKGVSSVFDSSHARK